MWFIRQLLRLRYSIHVKGTIPKTDSYLFVFSSLSSQLDPLLIASVLPNFSSSCHPRKIVTMRWLERLYQLLGWSPLPDREKASSSFAKRCFFRSLKPVIDYLQLHRSYLFFVLGHVQLILEPHEPRMPMIKEVCENVVPSPSVVYAQVHGMLGSLFSARPFGGLQAGRLTLGQIVVMLLKNGLFFMPKRQVVIEFSDQPPISRKEEVQFVPHVHGEKQIEIAPIDNSAEDLVFDKIAQLSHRSKNQIRLDQDLYEDLQLDSLDLTELTVWGREVFDRYVPFEKLQTVNDLVRLVKGNYQCPDYKAFEEKKRSIWFQKRSAKFAPRQIVGDTIIEAFLSICKDFESHIASVDVVEMMSYKRLKSAVIGLVEPFRSLKGKRIGLLLNNSNQFNIAYLALLFAGKVPTLINWTLGPRHVEEVVKMADLQVILTVERFYEHLNIELPLSVENKIQFLETVVSSLTSQHKMKMLQLSRQPNDTIMRHFNLHKFSGEDPAVLVFTSGTESHPKGVLLSHRNILANQRSLFSALEWNRDDVLLGILPAFHVYGFSFANLLPLLIGCRVVYVPSLLDFEMIANMVHQWKATIVASTPTFLKALLHIAKPEQLNSVRIFSIGAEPASFGFYELVKNIANHPTLVEGYGVTECSPCLTLNLHAGQRKGVGSPLTGIEILIVDSVDYNPLQQGMSGLVCARGENVFMGYLGGKPNPFIQIDGQQWYNTGDLGHLEADGTLILDGRMSRTIKIGGELVHLHAIEEIIQKKIPEASVAIIVEESEERPRLILYATHSLDLEKTNQWIIEAGLSNLLRLHEIRVIKEMPRLASGKINYRILK